MAFGGCELFPIRNRIAMETLQTAGIVSPMGTPSSRATFSSPPLAPRSTSRFYRLRLADSPEDVRAAQSLRFKVFNLELGEGLVTSFVGGLDHDVFDQACDHLLVEEIQTGEVVGTYRIQTGIQAARFHGFYSAREFNFTPFEKHRSRIVELGRACVAKNHRNLVVLGLLWSGIAKYSRERDGRYLIGCSSLRGTEPSAASAAFRKLAALHLASAEWQTAPTPAFSMNEFPKEEIPVEIPKLMSAYFSLGAKICGPPAIDREFGTIDFLTLLDLESLSAGVARRYFS